MNTYVSFTQIHKLICIFFCSLCIFLNHFKVHCRHHVTSPLIFQLLCPKSKDSLIMELQYIIAQYVVIPKEFNIEAIKSNIQSIWTSSIISKTYLRALKKKKIQYQVKNHPWQSVVRSPHSPSFRIDSQSFLAFDDIDIFEASWPVVLCTLFSTQQPKELF